MKKETIFVLGGFVLSVFLLGLAVICSKKAEAKASLDKIVQRTGSF